jgi:hypothetical protein
MSAVDPEIGLSAARLWLAAGSAALLVVVCGLAFARQLGGTMGAAVRTAAVIVGALLGGAIAWSFVDTAPVHNFDADRRALELRAEELAARALSPGSALPCLDALAGDSVETACEKALFASPSSTAAAVSYAAARLALLADMAAYVKRGGTDIEGAMAPLQRALEADRFGFVAHALAVREGCSNLDCGTLALLRNPNRIRANLNSETFERYVDRYQTVWAQPPPAPVADASQQSMTPAQLTASGQRKVIVNIDFPTAASIPPISIMSPEPGVKGPPSVAAAAAATTQAKGAPAAQRGRKAASAPAPEPAPQDPVYLPGISAPPAPAQAATSPSTPEASGGTAARTQ